MLIYAILMPMQTSTLIIIIVLAVFVLGIIFPFLFMRYVAWRVYQGTLVRTSPEVWGRHCSEPENKEQLAMWNKGLSWAASVGIYVEETMLGVLNETDRYSDIHIENDGFHLYGQYIDFGFDRAVIIIPGRCESLLYSYYFAPPYQAEGFNILVIDIRCHGLSSGKYDYVGIGEDSDMIAWAKILKERFGNKEVWLHGICMGANTAILAAANPIAKEKNLFSGMILEGPYVSFRENFKEHLVDGHHPVWPILDMVMNEIRRHTGVDVDEAAPIHYVGKLDVPALILAGKQDRFSVPEKTRLLFNACSSPGKKLVWFEKGAHSHLRIANESAYDQAISDWLKDLSGMKIFQQKKLTLNFEHYIETE